ncbi:GNAT family N-acetyltransferase [Zeaxanthinibacter sp. PT1]|uniref:GNAT family N-acetyltransferase n=1 Tax=Zeaxanthinibacter TaxID=561554 RepID=UPI00234B8860|nr:GNAT family N-acetyltransferase [Zeaxanthinibacter sp. PT1]MDC6352764.1 GNAT family N-acetyltransferase [Zeaxanthinibacter sp. PT1]
MNLNPFTSPTFLNIWRKHFCKDGDLPITGPFHNIRFHKNDKLPIYINDGANLTKGVDFQLDESNLSAWKGKTFLVYDVPQYFNIPTQPENKTLGHYKVSQYPGYLIDLSPYKNLGDFMSKRFSKSSRYKLNKYKRRLEESFDIRYKMFRGDIDRSEYDYIFKNFRELLEKRFDDKEVYNNNLDPAEWNFYHEVTYSMILEKSAGLYVIYHEDKPIGVTLNFFSEDILFDAITVFDIDFFKFHLGSVTIMKLIEWSLENDIKTFDFSKGYFDYKTRWASKEYPFDYHIYYDTNSLKASLIARSLKFYLQLKQSLRDKGFNEKLHKITYKLRAKKQEVKTNTTYEFTDVEQKPIEESLEKIRLTEEENAWLRPIIFEFLYLTTEHYIDIEVFRSKDEDGLYFISGKETTKFLQLN